MLILTFEEFNNNFNIDNSAMSDIRIKDIGKDISLTPIEIVMRDQTPNNISEPNSNLIVNLHPTEGTHWVLVIRREGGPVYYFDSFVIETPPLFLEEYVNLGSNERIQQYDESYCGAYCLYMIYLIDRGFRINNALNILVNQCKYPGMYNECFCLGCSKDKVDDNANQGTCFADDLRSSFANNVNQGTDSVRGMPTCFTDDNVNDNDNDNVNDNDNDNDIDNDNDKVMIVILSLIKIYEVALLIMMIMIMLMILLMITIMIMIILYIRGPALQIYLMKNIKGVNLIGIAIVIVLLIIYL